MIIDFELLRIWAILGGHFNNFWNIAFSLEKQLFLLSMYKLLMLLRKNLSESFCKNVH